MQLFWYGKSFVKIETKDALILFNPYSCTVVNPAKLNDAIVLGGDENFLKNMKDTNFTVDSDGEYETQGIYIYVSSVFCDKIKGKHFVYMLDIENISVVHLGNLSCSLNKKLLERLQGVDVLFVPVGGADGVLDNKSAVETVKALEPRIVVPVYYNALDKKTTLNTAANFIKELGVSDIRSEEKAKITAKDLPQDRLVVLQLSPLV